MAIERYSVGLSTPDTRTTGEAYAELLAGASDPVSIKSITVTTGSNIGGHLALTHSYAIGTGAASGIHTGVALRTVATSPTGPARAQMAWSNSGVAPTGYISRLKHIILPIATGQSRTLWDADTDGDLVIEPGKSVIVLNQGSGSAGGGIHVNFTWEEGRL